MCFEGEALEGDLRGGGILATTNFQNLLLKSKLAAFELLASVDLASVMYICTPGPCDITVEFGQQGNSAHF